MKCLDIIDLISMYDNDILIQYLAASFKNL